MGRYLYLTALVLVALVSTAQALDEEDPVFNIQAEESNEPAPLPPGAALQSGPAPGSSRLAISPNGRLLATATKEGKIQIWDAENFKSIKVLNAHTGACHCTAFTVDNKSLISCGADGVVKQWDLSTFAEVRKFEGHLGEVKSVACSPDGIQFAAGDGEGVRVWNLNTGKQMFLMSGHKVPQEAQVLAPTPLTIDSLGYSGDGTLLVSEANDVTARLWDPVHGRELHELTDHDGYFAVATLSPDNRLGVSTRQGGRARIFDAHTGEMLKTLYAHQVEVSSAVFSLDGAYVLTGGKDHCFRQWDTYSGVELRRFTLTSSPMAIVTTADGCHAVTLSSREGLALWDLRAAPKSNAAPIAYLDEAWQKLASNDYEERAAAYNFFLQDPAGVTHLADRLREPTPEKQREEQRALIRQLDDDNYVLRSVAFEKLSALGVAARNELAAARSDASTEVRLQVSSLLQAIGGSADPRRVLAIEILGNINSAAARRELDRLAHMEGAPYNAQARALLARASRVK